MSNRDATSAALGRLQTADTTGGLAPEARDFTRGLLLNADILSDVLGMQLELTEAEHTVGGFSLDLIGRDPGAPCAKPTAA